MILNLIIFKDNPNVINVDAFKNYTIFPSDLRDVMAIIINIHKIVCLLPMFYYNIIYLRCLKY